VYQQKRKNCETKSLFILQQTHKDWKRKRKKEEGRLRRGLSRRMLMTVCVQIGGMIVSAC
jgi:hypothetical protein